MLKMTCYEFLTLLANTSSVKTKKEMLKWADDSTDNEHNVKKIFKYAYDTVNFSYGVSAQRVTSSLIEFAQNLDKNLKKTGNSGINLDEIVPGEPVSFEEAFKLLDKLNAREITGDAALQACVDLCWKFNKPERDMFIYILDRDLHCGVNKTLLNKVWHEFIPLPKYNRCSVFSKDKINRISFPAYLQLKCDGTYREVQKRGTNITVRSRQGEVRNDLLFTDQFKDFPDGIYTGEITLGHAYKPDANRSVSNGLINSNNPPYGEMWLTLWDYLTPMEYSGLSKTPYKDRFAKLSEILKTASDHPQIELVPTIEVNSLDEVIAETSNVMSQGLEGCVLKDKNMVFKDGTNPQQMKIKLKVDCEMRITGFTEGTGKRAGKVGAICFESDDHQIKGLCSGFSDAEMDDFTNCKSYYIGKIISIEFNDLSKPEYSDHYALVHPRFVAVREDKDTTDTLETVKNLRDMARQLA